MPGYEVATLEVQIPGCEGMHIQALLDRQQFSDPGGEAEAVGISSATWSLFGQVWPSSVKLAELMNTWDLGARRVLEIGCGLALASLVVHRRHGNITASDYHPLAEKFLIQNARLNALPPLRYETGDWGGDNPALGYFDLIIGSDVLYDRSQPEALAAFVALHAAPKAEVLIVDPNRGNRSAFKRFMDSLGFALTETSLDSELMDGSAYKGRLLRFVR